MFFLKNFDSFHLEIVGFLAILGEGSVEANYQVSTLSNFIFIPRLLPAPQAFIRPSRPRRLETVPGIVVGTRSGNLRHVVNRVPHILLEGERKGERPQYHIEYMSIDETNEFDEEQNGGHAEHHLFIGSRALGPLSLMSALGGAMSIALFVLSIVWDDGWALLAVILLSSLSTLIGLGSKWSLELAKRTAIRKVPKSDVVVVYPNGSILVIKCSEFIARALFFAPETCIYLLNTKNYRLLALLATLILMFGVIALGNASLRLQVSFGVSYLLLNAGYWFAAALPEKRHWDIKSLRVTRYPELSSNKEGEENYTRVLWKAIAITGTTNWVKLDGQIVPVTDAWGEWLNKAGSALKPPNPNGTIEIPDWDCDKALTDALANVLARESPTGDAGEPSHS